MVSRILLAATLVLGFLAAETSANPLEALALPIALPQPVIPSGDPSFSYDAFYDLQNNLYKTNAYVTGSLSGAGCSTRGTLKLALASAAADPSRRRVLVDLFFTNPTGWTFNLGDSQTNNGYGGDSSSQSRDAEVHSVNANFYGYLSDHGGSAQAFAVSNAISTRLTLIAGDGHLVWLPNNNNLFNYYYNPNFFALSGQADTQGLVNYDLFLGLNQVVAGPSRTGSGLCKVGIKFLPEY